MVQLDAEGGGFNPWAVGNGEIAGPTGGRTVLATLTDFDFGITLLTLLALQNSSRDAAGLSRISQQSRSTPGLASWGHRLAGMRQRKPEERLAL